MGRSQPPPAARCKHGIALAWLCLGAAVAPAAVVAATTADDDWRRQSYLGMRLEEALRDLQSRGLNLVFSSRLVRPQMVVEREPEGEDLGRLLDELLAPHGLRAEDGRDATLVVVAAEPTRPASVVVGEVRSRDTDQPLGRVSIRLLQGDVEVHSRPNGRFELPELEPGVYALEARLSGYVPEEVRNVVVGPDRPLRLRLALQPAPFVNEEIAVRPSRLSLLQDDPAAPMALSRQEIEALPHLGGAAFRALSLLPGTAANDLTAQLHVHGGRRDEVQVILDGQELYDAYHLKDYDNAVSIVAAEGLGTVRLETGAFAANRGDRMSGVLDLRTVTPTQRRTHLGISILTALASGGGTFGDGQGYWQGSARRGSIDLAGRALGREDPSFWDAYGKAEYGLGDRNLLRGHLLRASDDLNFTETNPEEDESSGIDSEYTSAYSWLTHQAVAGRRLLVESSLSQSRIERRRDGFEMEEDQEFGILDRRLFEVGGLSQSWTLQTAADRIVEWGFEARSYEAVYDYFSELERDFIIEPSSQARPVTGATDFEGRFEGEHVGAWLTDRFSPVDPLTVELGVRFDRHTLTDDSLWSPRVNLALRLDEVSVVRAGWGHFHQTQRPYELQVEDGETGFSQAERSEHWVLGYERRIGGGEESRPLEAIRLELFHRDVENPRPRYENLIEPFNFFSEVEPGRAGITPESARASGFELLLRGSGGRRFGWWMNYTYSEAVDRIAEQAVRRSVDQPHALNLNLTLRLARAWDLSLAWRLHTGWPTTVVTLAEGAEDRLLLGPLNAERVAHYHRLDLRASRQWRLRSSEWTFFVDLQNVYNRGNLSGFDLEIDDGELVREEERWPGIFPSVGVSWEF